MCSLINLVHRVIFAFLGTCNQLGAEAGVSDLDAGVCDGGVLLRGAEHREASDGGGRERAVHP